MSSILLTASAVEPLSLADAKAYLRVATSDDDDLISALIVSARAQVEAQTRRALITQTWRLKRDAWPTDGRIEVLPVPLQQLTAARVYDENNNAQDLDLQAFIADIVSAPAVLSFAPWSLPQPGRDHGGIELDVTVGYGDAATDVPAPLTLAIRLLVAHWYENRGVAAAGTSTVAVLPDNVAALIAPFRVLLL